MALKYGDRVKETSATTGTGSYALAGAVSAFQAFSGVLANGDQCFYTAQMGTDWEVGLGTWSTGGTLARSSVLASSNGGAAVNWGAGTKTIWLDVPAEWFSQRRELLTANRTYYVRTDGNDSNDGLANSSGRAFATLQKAWDTACLLDAANFKITISVADGTYSNGIISASSPVSGSEIEIVGNTGTPSNVHINSTDHCFKFSGTLPSPMAIKGFRCTFAGSSKTAVELAAPGTITVSAMVLSGGSTGFRGAYTAAVAGAKIIISTGQTINGNMSCFCQAADGGFIAYYGITVTLTGTPVWSWVGHIANNQGFISAVGVTFSGAASGKRYEASTNAMINTNGGGASYFPGSTAGSTATSGVYA